ncbi:MAG: hypothetical protein ABJG86_22645 [Nitratireductor sp.]
MKYTFPFSVPLVLALLLGVTAAEAKTYKGYWDNNPQWSSTLDFLGEKRLTYCFQGQCHTTRYSGSSKGTVRFNWGAANFRFEWNGSGYTARRSGSGFSNTGFLK